MAKKTSGTFSRIQKFSEQKELDRKKPIEYLLVDTSYNFVFDKSQDEIITFSNYLQKKTGRYVDRVVLHTLGENNIMSPLGLKWQIYKFIDDIGEETFNSLVEEEMPFSVSRDADGYYFGTADEVK